MLTIEKQKTGEPEIWISAHFADSPTVSTVRLLREPCCLVVWLSGFLVFSFLIWGCADNPQMETMEAEQNLEKGWLEYSKGNYDAAMLSFERAISLNDLLSDAYNGLGWSHLSAPQSSNFNPQLVLKALSAFQESIRRDDNNADAWVGLANSLFLRRKDLTDFQTAIQALDNALKANPDSLYRHDYDSAADIHALKAVCLYYSGDMKSADIEAKSALDVDNKNQTALAIRKLLNGNFL